MKKFSISILAIVFGMLGIIAQGQDLPNTITIESDNLLPEGVEWDSTREQFLVGSWTQKTVFAVADDGTLTPILEDDDLYLINGIHVDNENGRLLVSNTDTDVPIHCPDVRGAMPFTAVGIYDLASGERIQMVDLTDLVPERGSLINDLTSDTEGNIYATDWCGSALYKIDTEGNASILIDDDSFYFETEIGAGAFNGIDWHPDNYLIMSGGFGDPLYKVTLDDAVSVTAIELDAPAFADGITMLPDGDVAIIGALFSDEAEFGFFNTTMRFTSDDDWQSASLVTNVIYDRFATTGVLRDDAFYVVKSGVIEPLPVSTFEILRVDLEPEAMTEAEEVVVDPNSIFALLERNISYSTFAEALVIAGLEETVREDDVMVFALSNAGFRGALSRLSMTVDELFADEDLLTEVISMHIYEERATTGQLIGGTNLVTISGEQLVTFSTDDPPSTVVEDSFGRTTSLLNATLSPTNGVIYPISGLILPASFPYEGEE